MSSIFHNNDPPKQKHQMKNEWDRLSSFITLVLNIWNIKPLQLAKDGLFYNSDKNSVICFSCEQETVIDSNFQSKCIDGNLHQTTCAMKGYTRTPEMENLSENISISHANENLYREINTELHKKYCIGTLRYRYQTTLENCHDVDLNTVQESLQPSVNWTVLDNAEYENSSHRSNTINGEQSKKSTMLKISKSPVTSTPSLRPRGEGYKNSKTDENELQEENRRLMDRKLCTICLDEIANILLFPCAHIPCCVSCSVPLTKCPICRQEILGTVLTKY